MHPWTFSADIERSVLEGLNHLIKETAIHPPSGLRLYADDGGDVATKTHGEMCCGRSRVYAIEPLPAVRSTGSCGHRGVGGHMQVG